MFKAYFGMSFDPFQKDIDVKYQFKSKDFNEALSRLEFLKTTKGIGLLTGEPGVGKTFLLRSFAASLNPNMYKCIWSPGNIVLILFPFLSYSYFMFLSPSTSLVSSSAES